MRAAVSMRWVVCSMRRYATGVRAQGAVVPEVNALASAVISTLRTRPCGEGYHVMRRAMLFLTLVLPVWLGAPVTALAVSRDQESPWRYVPLTGAAPAFPVRIVGQEERWEHVVQDIQARLSSPLAGRAIRVGVYGHGAFVTPREVLHALPFVAALGAEAAMDVMLFPHWRFPDAPPWLALPRDLLQAQLSQGLPRSVEAGVERLRRTARQVALEHRAATAQAAVRLAEGLSVLHRRQMVPSLAAFSASALVLVRLQEIIEYGQVADGHTPLPVAASVRQGVSLHNVVLFGYPLPNGQVSPALRQRIRGTFVNVVPAHCEHQWQGNFPLRGAVHNLPVSWAPAHADWPRLAPQGPEVAALGALLGGRDPALARRRDTFPSEGQEGNPVGRQLWEPLCAALQRLDPAGAFRVLD